MSVRGWIADVELPPTDNFMVTDPYLQIQRKYAIFRDTAISVEGVQYVSGGVAETGAFIMLDVPPGDSIINFQPPGLPDAQLKLRQIPGNGDVLLPGLLIKGTQVVLFKPEEAMVRVAGRGVERKKLDIPAFVGDQKIDVWEVPLAELVDRREYPTPTTRLSAPSVPTVK
ncbi:MAG: hypothetical protein HYU52_12705 [Acidobacteria bacterium]|nr:hypothetical protein [Acidobacteriota bacterium]